jgi:hypothetical protein
VEDSSPPFCFFADRRLARDIQRTRSATHHILWCLVLGASDDAVSFAGTVIQHAVDATSTRAAAAEFESADRPEKTAAEPAATATVASATAAASAAASAGRSSGNGAGALPATARTAAARRGREPGRVATAQRGARPRLERCERDQRLAEAAVRVGEAEEVVEQALRERGPGPQPAQRLPHLRVVEQLRERDEHARDLRRGGRHGRRDGGGGRGPAEHQAQRGHVVVQLEDQRVEAAGKAGRADAVRRQLVARARQVRRPAGLRRRERDGAAVPSHHGFDPSRWSCSDAYAGGGV